jgi:hypothetical protein
MQRPVSRPSRILLPAAPFCSVTRTPEELSIVAPAEAVPAAVAGERGWRCLAVAGPLPLDAVGVLAAIAEQLARAGISLFAVSTYDTDYVLVRVETLDRATSILARAGHEVG